MRAKSFDTFGPLLPELVPVGELGDGSGLRITQRLNGETLQDASTRDLIFDVPTLVAYASGAFTLEPGDVILTGTPSGVGVFRDPPRRDAGRRHGRGRDRAHRRPREPGSRGALTPRRFSTGWLRRSQLRGARSPGSSFGSGSRSSRPGSSPRSRRSHTCRTSISPATGRSCSDSCPRTPSRSPPARPAELFSVPVIAQTARRATRSRRSLATCPPAHRAAREADRRRAGPRAGRDRGCASDREPRQTSSPARASRARPRSRSSTSTRRRPDLDDQDELAAPLRGEVRPLSRRRARRGHGRRAGADRGVAADRATAFRG